MREDVRCVKAKRVTLYQRLQHRGFNGDGRTDGLRPSRASLRGYSRFFTWQRKILHVDEK